MPVNLYTGRNLCAYGKKFTGIRMRFQEEMRVALKQGVSVIFRTLNTEGRNRRKLAVNEVSRSAELATANISLLKELSDFSSVGFLMGLKRVLKPNLCWKMGQDNPLRKCSD